MSYLRRFLWFVLKRLLGFTMVFGALIIAFYIAMNTANITILLKDGMALRTQVIMMSKEEDDLTKYFQQEFVHVDPALTTALAGQSVYTNYSITGIDHRISLEWMWCWPWDDVAHADFVESVPKIDGRVKSSLRTEAEKAGAVSPPAWETARYRATLVREGGRWKIASIKKLQTVP